MIIQITENYIIFLLVVTRIAGAFLFNPLLGKKNIPAIAKIGLAAVIAVGIFPSLGQSSVEFISIVHFTVVILKELLVGFCIGIIMNMFMSVALIAGESIDVQIGLGMAKVYDPQSNTSMALTGSIYNLFFILMFFVSDGHLTLIKIVTDSCTLFPVGDEFINFKFFSYAVLLFGDVLILALKLAIPVVAIEFLAEAGLGVLMRIVPHINIFAIGLQIKLAIGMAITLLTVTVTTRLMDSTMTYMFKRIEEGVSILLSP